MTKTRYVDITCDGCQCGWTLTPKDELEAGATYMKRTGWVVVGQKHFCAVCVAKGLATDEVHVQDGRSHIVAGDEAESLEEDFWAGLKED